MSLGALALRKIWKLKGLINVEKKKFDIVNTGANILNSGSITHLTAIAQGDTDQNRNGNSVFVRSVNLKGTLNIHASAANSWLRMSLIMDTQQIADTAPAFADIYESTDVNSHLNNLTVGRFKVLASKTYALDAVNSNKILYLNVPMRHHVRYNGTAGTDQQKGALYLVFVSNEGTNGPLITHETRVSFHDN